MQDLAEQELRREYRQAEKAQNERKAILEVMSKYRDLASKLQRVDFRANTSRELGLVHARVETCLARLTLISQQPAGEAAKLS